MKKDKLRMLCLGTILSACAFEVEASSDFRVEHPLEPSVEITRPTPRWFVARIGDATIYETEKDEVMVEVNSIKTKGPLIDLRVILTDVLNGRTFEHFYSLMVGIDYNSILSELRDFINFHNDVSFRIDIIPFLVCESIPTTPTRGE